MSGKFFWINISRRYLTAFGLLVVVLALLTLPESYHLAVVSTVASTSKLEYDVVLDAGHGGIDPGGIGAGDVYEKDLVLDIVLRMRDYLEQAGFKVGLTRDSDKDVTELATKGGTRHQRDLEGRFIALHAGTVGMSVHANVSKDKSENGALVFYMKNSYIDRQYAQIVLEQIERIQVLNDRAPIPRSNLFLIKAKPPVLLVELGFLSNTDDLAKLVDPNYRQHIAAALSRGIIQFLQIYRLEQSE